ncbi:Neuroparsin-A [Frankliniella fusca]|uniref:Neuroparsin-A n=1 Tax=Frankliniella fusca TaxID=407009 RepID=A0AAE1HZ20_9NEOP|nr:Neuroparsin-A [Frankliniella fusca]
MRTSPASPLRAVAEAAQAVASQRPRLLLLLLSVAVGLALAGAGAQAEARPEASNRGGLAGLALRCEPLPEPEDCLYGLARDHCGRVVCAKGPGERCGGPLHLTCGEGMYCKCERCIGCSLNTFTCFLGSAVCM